MRPWSTVLRVPTAAGPVWFKAGRAATAFEAGLLLAARARRPPARARADRRRPGARLDAAPRRRSVAGRARRGGRARRRASPPRWRSTGGCSGRSRRTRRELLALGVPDMRPAVMPERFAEALRVVEAIGERTGHPEAAAVCRRVASLERGVRVPTASGSPHRRCRRASTTTTSTRRTSSATVATCATTTGATRWWRTRSRRCSCRWASSRAARPSRAARARDAYLGEFADVAPYDELVATLELACRVAKVARVLTWERAVRSAWEEGEMVEDAWAVATIATLGAVGEPSYLSLG